jgi:hypothetical protein
MLEKRVKVVMDNIDLGDGLITFICDTKEKLHLYFNQDHPLLKRFYSELDNERKIFIVDFEQGGQGGYTIEEIKVLGI